MSNPLHQRAEKILQKFRGNFSLTLSAGHTRYLIVSNFNDAVPICDSGTDEA
jgi:hypothetical protein